jgi:hypothetical protein
MAKHRAFDLSLHRFERILSPRPTPCRCGGARAGVRPQDGRTPGGGGRNTPPFIGGRGKRRKAPPHSYSRKRSPPKNPMISASTCRPRYIVPPPPPSGLTHNWAPSRKFLKNSWLYALRPWWQIQHETASDRTSLARFVMMAIDSLRTVFAPACKCQRLSAPVSDDMDICCAGEAVEGARG